MGVVCKYSKECTNEVYEKEYCKDHNNMCRFYGCNNHKKFMSDFCSKKHRKCCSMVRNIMMCYTTCKRNVKYGCGGCSMYASDQVVIKWATLTALIIHAKNAKNNVKVIKYVPNANVLCLDAVDTR